MQTTKQCTKCKLTKQLSEFNNDVTTKDGKKSYCKACTSIMSKNYAIKNANKIIAYRKANVDKMAVYRKKHHEENREHNNATNRARYQLTKESVKKQQQIYNQTPTGKMNKTNQVNRRRALRVARSDGSIPQLVTSPLTTELQQLLQSQDHKCTSCNCDISEGANPRHLDHIQPLSKGGTHTLDNVQWLCATCNLTKGNR